MKKLMALFVMAIFLVSLVPVAVFADEGSETDSGSGSEDLVETETEVETSTETTTESEATTETSETTASTIESIDRSEIRAKLKERKIEIKKKHKELREKFFDAKTRFMESKKAFLDERIEFRTKVAEIKKQCRDSETEKCRQLKVDARAEARVFLQKSADAIINILEKRKAMIESSDLENKDELVAEIDERIQTVNDAMANLGEDPTKEELKEAAKILREQWRTIKKHLAVTAGEILRFKMAGFLVRIEHLEAKLDKTLARLESKGYDVSELEGQISTFKEHVAEARDLHAQAVVKFSEAKQSSDPSVLVKEGHALLVEAHKHLKLAHETLKEIVKTIKGLPEGEDELEELSEETEESEETTETEVETSTETTTESEVTTETTSEADVSEETSEGTEETQSSNTVEVTEETSVGV